jgi:hypothetical protein
MNRNSKSKISYLGYSVESLELMESIQNEVFRKYGLMDLIDKFFRIFFGGSDNFHGLPLRFLRIILCNQLNPPIQGIVFERIIVEIYISQYFTNVLQNLTSDDIESANSGGLGIIIVSMTLGFCHEFAYRHAYNSFPDLPKSKHLSLQIATSLRASQFHTAIFAHALNISSTKCASFPINLPKCGDCATVLRSKNNSDPDIMVHFTELKLCHNRAVRALKNDSFLKNKRNGLELFTNTTCKMFSSCIEDFREIGGNCIFLLKIIVPENPIGFDFPVSISRIDMRNIFYDVYQKTWRLFTTLIPKNKSKGFPKFDSDFKEIIQIFESYSKSPSSLNSSVSSVSLQLSNKTNMRRNSMYSSNLLFDFESRVGASAMGGPSSGRGNRNGASARGRLNSSVSSASLQLSNNSMYSSNPLFDFESRVGVSAMGSFKALPKSKSKNSAAMAGPGPGLEEEELFLRLDSRNGSKTKNRAFGMGRPIPGNTGSVMWTKGFGGPFKTVPKSKSKNSAAMAGPGPGLEEEELFLRLDSRSLKSKSENIGNSFRTLTDATAMRRPNSGPVNGAFTAMSRTNSAPVNSAFAMENSILRDPLNNSFSNLRFDPDYVPREIPRGVPKAKNRPG